jgi:hypothetical protein
MFIVKFCSFFEDGSSTTTSISCAAYTAYRRKNGSASIVTHKDMTDNDGVERHVSSEEIHDESEPHEKRDYFDACFIENISGKTIDIFKAAVPEAKPKTFFRNDLI